VADQGWLDRAVKNAGKKKTRGRPSPNPKKGPANNDADDSGKMRVRIENTIRSIPRGKVSTYGAIARIAGFPGNARFVARVLHRGFGLPWQRVLGAGGEIKLRGDSALEQRFRLEAEGVRFRGRKVDIKAHEWKRQTKTPPSRLTGKSQAHKAPKFQS
jgi:methylated-DNA-protein-cysteine methyltransferase related protein